MSLSVAFLKFFGKILLSFITTMANEEKTETGPMNIATISAGFEKGDFLVREEQGNRVYFDFFEEVSKCIFGLARPCSAACCAEKSGEASSHRSLLLLL